MVGKVIKALNKKELGGRCRNCGAELSLEIGLGQIVLIKTGGIFRPRYEPFMRVHIDEADRRCPTCGYELFA